MPLSTLAAIIERDSKATTYKFALLRATIDVAVENSLRVVKHLSLLLYRTRTHR